LVAHLDHIHKLAALVLTDVYQTRESGKVLELGRLLSFVGLLFGDKALDVLGNAMQRNTEFFLDFVRDKGECPKILLEDADQSRFTN